MVDVGVATRLADEVMTTVIGPLCSNFSGGHVTIRPDAKWDCGYDSNRPDACISGTTRVDSGVTVGSDLRSLVHELFHAYETNHLRYSAGHKGWNQNGYTAASATYQAHLLELTAPAP